MTYSGGIFSSISPQSSINVIGSTMYLPNTNCPGVAFNVVCNVLRIVYAAEDKNGPQGSFSVNTSGKAGAQIPQLPLGDNSSPWGDNAVCMYPHTAYTDECNKSLTATYQCKIQIPSNTLLANNILNNN
jgi:hypothetical protein